MKTNHRLLCLAPAGLLLACSSHADSGPPAQPPAAPSTAAPVAPTPAALPHRMFFRPGSYSARCAIDSTQRLRLIVAHAKAQYPAQLYGRGGKLLAQGNLQLDTVDYDRQDSIFSFRAQGQVYAFMRDQPAGGIRLINEDYKKNLQYCFDGKSIGFEWQPR